MERLINYLKAELQQPVDAWNDYTFIGSRAVKGFICRLLVFIENNYGKDELK